jgi:DNA polymerase I
MSCTEPNLQQCPRDRAFRDCFRASPGHVLVVGDYSSMELRGAAEVSNDPVMREDFRKPGYDPHRRLAAAINRIPEAAVTPEQRQGAKAINFGTIYGAGGVGLAASAWASYGIKLSPDEALAARTRFFAHCKVLQSWMGTHAHACRCRGYIDAGPLGRVIEAAWERAPEVLRARHWHEDTEDEDGLEPEAEELEHGQRWQPGPVSPLKYTLSCNAPIQGACADCTMTALTLIDRALTEAAIDGGVILAVHDEFVLDVLEAQAPAAAEILEKCMVDAFRRIFPNAPVTELVDVKTALTWGEAKA